jgi:hypothetical protein
LHRWVKSRDAEEKPTVRYMLLLKGDPQPGENPSEELIGAMLRYNEELVKAGVLLAGEGLHDSSKGARVVYSGGERTVIDGPFAESKELVAGFLLIQVSSKEEAIEWAKRCPVDVAVRGTDREAVVEVRQVAEVEDMPTFTEEQRATERSVRDQLPGL